jgi:hypothetical protein
MGEMKHYSGTYSYNGTFKQLKDGSSLLEVSWFTYGGKYYLPTETLKFVMKNEPNEWISVTDDSVGVREGGETMYEALGNAFMMAASNYEDYASYTGELTKGAQEVKDKVQNWEVYAIDSKAQ